MSVHDLSHRFRDAEQEHTKHFMAPLIALSARPAERGLARLVEHTSKLGYDRASKCFDAALEAVQDGIRELEGDEQ